MQHIAIMNKKWKLIKKILSCQKSIESRWYKNKYSPWNRIKAGENIYFKNSGGFVECKAKVDNVIQFSDLTPNKIMLILQKYGESLGLEDIYSFFPFICYKKYCILLFLRNARKIKPFDINKFGFGLMTAWISIENINDLKRNF
jgi:hypothetical protein